ncbi:hypothetical protein [Acetobacter okinawensis]|uniref:hypothetical protein n=1 Tax=Acetobacter okinawensis TaxID=1076594 RepID=UPI00046F1A30|nr:hypothetical protein [Acetobacter okinawensis]
MISIDLVDRRLTENPTYYLSVNLKAAAILYISANLSMNDRDTSCLHDEPACKLTMRYQFSPSADISGASDLDTGCLLAIYN